MKVTHFTKLNAKEFECIKSAMAMPNQFYEDGSGASAWRKLCCLFGCFFINPVSLLTLDNADESFKFDILTVVLGLTYLLLVMWTLGILQQRPHK